MARTRAGTVAAGPWRGLQMDSERGRQACSRPSSTRRLPAPSGSLPPKRSESLQKTKGPARPWRTVWGREQHSRRSPPTERGPRTRPPPRSHRMRAQAGAAVDTRSFPAFPRVIVQLGPCVPMTTSPMQTALAHSRDGCGLLPRGRRPPRPPANGSSRCWASPTHRPGGRAAVQTLCANCTHLTHLPLQGAAPWGVRRRGFCGAGVPPPLPAVTVHSPPSASISLKNMGGAGPPPEKSREGSGRAETTASARQRHGSCSVQESREATGTRRGQGPGHGGRRLPGTGRVATAFPRLHSPCLLRPSSPRLACLLLPGPGPPTCSFPRTLATVVHCV